FSSPTAGLLMCWHYSGTTAKSIPELNRLGSYTRDPQFNAAEELPFSHERERKLIEKYLRDQSNPFQAENGWSRSSVTIPLPKENAKYRSENDSDIPTITVDNVIHRSITDIIKSVFEDDISSTFHMTPFEQFWKTSDERVLKVYSEAYSSPAMLDAYKEINALPRAPGDNYERVVASLMLWSDATQLANFGDASLWPIYLFFGNQSKYTHSKPTAGACHHVAYIPTLPDDFQDTYLYHYGNAATEETYTHCKRELIHAIWKLLLNEEFVEAYRKGILIRCADGITRRIFPRFFTYSADYPEKVLLACIKFLGQCPCPRCLVKKADIPDMGKTSDMATRTIKTRINDRKYQNLIKKARKQIYKKGKGINSKSVADLLKGDSLAPTRNAFSEQLRVSDSENAFNFFLLFIVDLLHEFELRVWKAI
ncbi:hypothetical protein PAXINDRAFT_52664, partial [Paxillus involutus ATCC 200175]